MIDALVIGAGPAGLMAAEVMARAGRRVVVVDAKPSVGRKFLMAGKSGLNLTKDEPFADVAAAFGTPWLTPMLADFGPDQVVDWCRSLGQEVFVGSSGRVFPVAMKASPLLRAWMARLADLGVEARTRWRWTGFDGDALTFATPEGVQAIHPAVTVLALGGASWSRLGSDGAWAPLLRGRGVEITAFRPANMGFVVNWSPHMARHFGQPVKGCLLMAGARRERGEFVVSARGVEGGGIYAVSAALRDGARLTIDLMPDLTAAQIADRLHRMKPSESRINKMRKLGLSAVAIGLIMEFGRNLPLLDAVKALPVALQGPRPMDEAISTAGGIARSALTVDLALQAIPRMFACGEMLDWEAPTGGYLLTGCLATGAWAGKAAAQT